MTTDRLALMDAPWDDSWERRRPGWLARLGAALGRIFGRKPAGLQILEPGAEPEVGERTRPIDTTDLLDERSQPIRRRPAPAARAPQVVPHAHHAPPPVPGRASAIRLATAAAALGPDEFDPLDALITMVLGSDDAEPPPAPTTDQLVWLEVLGPLIEYELMERGSTAITFQSTAAQLGELVALADTDFNAAVRLVSRDPAIAASVLSAANSVERQRGAHVSDIRTAVSRLGLAETRRIGIAAASRALYDADAQAVAAHHRARSHRDLHRSMTCAFASAALAARSGAFGGEDAFVTGMFVDLGRPLVHRAIMALERRRRVEAVPADALELVIERTHAAVGAEALAAWGLPRRLGELARHHLTPVPPAAIDGPDLQRLALVSSLVLLRVGEPVSPAAARRAAAQLDLGRAELRTLALEVVELAGRVTELFGVRDGDTTWGAPVLPR
ncbi:MAG TPA: HDOD domain-containing protein [Kofleriaceae bacterium]|nr:HDOD domain-containing protein [Kofleriaceae bacterium]